MNEKFESWAIVEIFGHQRFAGQISEQSIGGCSFVRIDVPATDNSGPVTKLYGDKAIYCITPVTEEIARAAANQMQVKPVTVYDFSDADLEKFASKKISHQENYEDDDYPI